MRFLFVFCFVVMLAARMIAPSALQRFDQPRTVSYTADIVCNGRWILPRDIDGRTATKPPLVNWLAAPIVAAGFWKEWAVKAPMVVANIVTAVLIVWMARRLFRKIPETHEIANDAAWLAGIIWVVNPANVTMIYHARPDPVLVMFLTAAWICGTLIICEEQSSRIEEPSPQSPPWQGEEDATRQVRVDDSPKIDIVIFFWIAIGLAGLTKGIPAILPIIFFILAARVIGGRWSIVNRSKWWWGFPLALGVFSIWGIPAAILSPKYFFGELLGQELINKTIGIGEQVGRGRVRSEGPMSILKGLGQNPVWFLQRFAPWSLLALGGAGLLAWPRFAIRESRIAGEKTNHLFRHALSPVVLWVLLVLLFFSFSAHKTADYILPAYPAAAILAAYFCVTLLARYHIRARQVGVAALLMAIGFGIDEIYFSNAARDRAGENLKEFAREVDRKIDKEPVVFQRTGYNTLQFFLHRHQAGALTTEEIARAKWAIIPLQTSVPAELISKPVPRMQTQLFVLGLYRVEDVRDVLMEKRETKRE